MTNTEKAKVARTLNANEIECRVGTIGPKGLSLLLYKDARADMKLMDELYGSMNWQRRHEVIGGNLYCIVSVWDPDKGEWVSKMDVGTESYTEKEKGQASDSFKRACVNFGIGRELYTAPFIWINAQAAKIEKDTRGKDVTKERFSVSEIAYNEEREISHLRIVNKAGNVVYGFDAAPAATLPQNEPEPDVIKPPMLLVLRSEIKRTGGNEASISKWAKVNRLEDLTGTKAAEILHTLKKRPDAPPPAPPEEVPSVDYVQEGLHFA